MIATAISVLTPARLCGRLSERCEKHCVSISATGTQSRA